MVFALGFAGCGTNLNEVFYQSATAVGQTTLDLFLTDLANRLADAVNQDDAPADAGGAGEDGTGGGIGDGGGGIDGPVLDDLTGDVTVGRMVYESNNCGSCHCADAAGGCALDAPSILGVDVETVDDLLRGTASHPSKPDLTNQEIVDLTAYLNSL